MTNRIPPPNPERNRALSAQQKKEQAQRLEKQNEIDLDQQTKRFKQFMETPEEETEPGEKNMGDHEMLPSPFHTSFYSPPSTQKSPSHLDLHEIPSPSYSSPPDLTETTTHEKDPLSDHDLPQSKGFWTQVDLPDQPIDQTSSLMPEPTSGEKHEPGKTHLPGQKSSREQKYEPGQPSSQRQRSSAGEKYTPGQPSLPGQRSSAGEKHTPGQPSLPGQRSSAGEKHTPGQPSLPGQRSSTGEKHSLEQPSSPKQRSSARENDESLSPPLPGQKNVAGKKPSGEQKHAPGHSAPLEEKHKQKSSSTPEKFLEPSPFGPPGKLPPAKQTSSKEPPPFIRQKAEEEHTSARAGMQETPTVHKKGVAPIRKTPAEVSAEEIQAVTTPKDFGPISGHSQGGQKGGHGREQKKAIEIEQPALPLFPPGVQPMAASATSAAASYLHPQVQPLFYQMVGTIQVMKNQGVNTTEITLNNPAFAGSKFYGTSIEITKYASAPDSLNIRLSGTNEAVTEFNKNIPSLVAAFSSGKFQFRIGRIDAVYSADKPVFRRKEEKTDDLSDQSGGGIG